MSAAHDQAGLAMDTGVSLEADPPQQSLSVTAALSDTLTAALEKP